MQMISSQTKFQFQRKLSSFSKHTQKCSSPFGPPDSTSEASRHRFQGMEKGGTWLKGSGVGDGTKTPLESISSCEFGLHVLSLLLGFV